MQARNGTEMAVACPAWYALQVQSPRERTVRDGLRIRGVEEFLPLYRTESRWSDRTKVIERALFPGYIFARLERGLPPFVRGIIGVVSIGGEPAPIPDEQIERVRRLVESPLAIEPVSYAIAAGQLVEIRRGPLVGMLGQVLKVKNAFRVVLRMELLHRAVSVELDADSLKPLNGSQKAAA